MDRELERKIKRMTDEGLEGLDFNAELKGKVREKVKRNKPYRRRWYAPVISFLLVLLFVFIYAVVNGEKLGFIGSEWMSGFFANSSNFDIEISTTHGPSLSTFDGAISRGDKVMPISFSKEERDEIYAKIEEINFKEEKNLNSGENCSNSTARIHMIKVRLNKEYYQYQYSDCPTTKDSRELDSLREMILKMIKEKPGYEEIVKPYVII
ncbi:hypothetical protein AAEO50_06890 [Rossellomorea oryzaecorticis]|uniref:Uncharacterized protein n=1 Tax=Rossellomorea oryzaecorticis TaxID=1396505 RepID=A0ABU9K7I7_9BACI